MTEQTKADARNAAFARRKEAHSGARAREAQAHLRLALNDQAGRPLAGYMPIRTEVDPVPVMAEWNGPVGVPVIVAPDHPLDFHRWNAGVEMIAGPFGAAVPKSAIPLEPEVLIVPLVAFDASGNRLGYGGGFYDRTLEGLRANRATLAIGFAYAAQEAAGFPLEPTDQLLDALVTENGVRWFGA